MKVACDSCGGRGWRWKPGTGPSCVHSDQGDVCDSCTEFLERLLPVIENHAGHKPDQEHIATMIGYTARHLRRRCADLGFRSWSAFYVAARDGMLNDQRGDAGNTVIVPFRKLA